MKAKTYLKRNKKQMGTLCKMGLDMLYYFIDECDCVEDLEFLGLLKYLAHDFEVNSMDVWARTYMDALADMDGLED